MDYDSLESGWQPGTLHSSGLRIQCGEAPLPSSCLVRLGDLGRRRQLVLLQQQLTLVAARL